MMVSAVILAFILIGCYADARHERLEREKWRRWRGVPAKSPTPWYLTPEGKAALAEGQRQLDEIARAKAD
jgi:hypothetical protein